MIEAGLDIGTELDGGWALTAGVWYATVNGTSGDFDEVDYYGGVSKGFELGSVDLNLESGYIYYDFPTGGANLQEIYFGVSTNVRDWFDIGYTYYWDIDGDNDGYSEININYSREFNDQLTFNGNFTLAIDTETGDLHHYGSHWTLDWAFNDVLTVSPYIAYTIAQDGVQDGALSTGSGQGDELFGGIMVTAGF